jgi:hypothetical protein
MSVTSGASMDKDGKDQASAKKEMAESNVAPTDPVITIPGACDNPDTAGADCKTVITRAEFDKLMSAVAPNAPPNSRRSIATRYAQMIGMADSAKKMGLDKGDRYDEMMKLNRMQVLAQLLQQHVQEEAGKVSDKEVEDYYNQNKSAYEEATLQRIFVPKTKQMEPPKEKLSDAETQKRQEENEAAMKKEAEDIQKKAAAGGDFSKLQIEAFDFAGMKSNAPNNTMPNMRVTSLPLTHRSVFDMKAGEVSPVIADGAGYFIYKMGEKQTLALDKVKEEIHNQLRAQRLQEQMSKMQQQFSPELSDAYFGKQAAEDDEPPKPAGARPMPKSPAAPKSK